MRFSAILSVSVGILGVAGISASAFAGGTTRIETRPFYGAIVTEEEGVRVFRPLPPTERVIVNPEGRTPLSLGFNETYVTERNYNYNYNETRNENTTNGGIIGGLYGGYGYGFGRGLNGHGHGGGHRGHGGGAQGSHGGRR
ncbi:MAG: hypothetical protein ACK5KM_15160 [Hyphomicrobiaceae bacterium]